MRTTTLPLRPLLTVLAAMLLLASCHSTKEVALPEPTPHQPAPPVVQHEKSVMNFTATVEGIGVNGQMRMAYDSVIWVSVTKLVELGRAMATPDSVWVNAPLLDKHFKGDYADLSRRAKRTVTFETLQEIATSDNAEELIVALANSLGINATVRLNQRRRVERISFPFVKP